MIRPALPSDNGSVKRFGGLRLLLLLLLCLLQGLTGSLQAQSRVDLPAQDRSLSMAFEDVYSVGSMVGEVWETFSQIAGVAFDDGGNLYLLDADNFRVVKVGPDGGFLAEMGGEGGGPGEFGMPLALAVSKDGEVRVFDMGHGGFSVFASDGIYKTSVPLAPGTMIFPSGGLLTHPSGAVVSPGGGVVRTRSGGGGLELPATVPVHLFTLADEVKVDTLYEAWNPATAGGTPSLETTEGAGVRFQAPPMRAFDPETLAGIFPDGRIALVDSTTYDVKVLSPHGQLQQTLHRSFTPREVTRRDRDAEKERRLAEMEASGGPRIVMRTDDGNTSSMASGQAKAMMEARIESMVFASEIPVLAGLGVDWDGRVWLRRHGARVGEEGPLDLLGSEGAYLGTVPPELGRIPDAFGPNGLAAFIEEDELGIPRVVVQRVVFR